MDFPVRVYFVNLGNHSLVIGQVRRLADEFGRPGIVAKRGQTNHRVRRKGFADRVADASARAGISSCGRGFLGWLRIDAALQTHTRRAYARAAVEFFDWLAARA